MLSGGELIVTRGGIISLYKVNVYVSLILPAVSFAKILMVKGPSSGKLLHIPESRGSDTPFVRFIVVVPTVYQTLSKFPSVTVTCMTGTFSLL